MCIHVYPYIQKMSLNESDTYLHMAQKYIHIYMCTCIYMYTCISIYTGNEPQ